MRIGVTLCFALFLFAVVVLVAAQDEKKQVKRVPVKPTSAASGQEMFTSYCASCHGKDAKGDGPAASALKSAPADLTALAKKNGGKYPSDKVTAILRGQADVTAHGTREMPVWGPVFWHMSGGHESETMQRIANLNHYIESLQGK